MYNEEDVDGTEEFMGAPNEIDPTAHLNEMVETKVPETKAQDLHSTLHCVLESYVETQDSGGLPLDTFYKGKLHKLQFTPYCHCTKGDTVEHDKHCGSYGARTGGEATVQGLLLSYGQDRRTVLGHST